MLELHREQDGKILVVFATGRLVKADYEYFAPEVNELIARYGKIRVLFHMLDFHGWTPRALWADLKLTVGHFRGIERLAVVGDKAWEHCMAVFYRPFTGAKIRYFDRSDEDEAREWIGLEPARSRVLQESAS